MGRYKKEKKANNPAPPKNKSVPEGAASPTNVPSRLPPKPKLATLSLIRISSQPIAPEKILKKYLEGGE